MSGPLLYVCASSADHELASQAIELIHSLGLEVSHDWTLEVRAALARAPGSRCADFLLGVEHSSTACGVAIDAVRRAHAVVWIVPEHGSTGAGVETGIAHERGTFLVACGPHLRRTVFSRMANAEREDMHAAVYIAAKAARKKHGR